MAMLKLIKQQPFVTWWCIAMIHMAAHFIFEFQYDTGLLGFYMLVGMPIWGPMIYVPHEIMMKYSLLSHYQIQIAIVIGLFIAIILDLFLRRIWKKF